MKEYIAQNYFKTNNIYNLEYGVPMGSPLSPLIAEMLMDNLVNKIFNNKSPLTKHVVLCCSYVDDICCIVKSTAWEIDDFPT